MDNKQNAKFAFYYLLSLVALIFMSISVGMIVFGIIDKTIIDALNYGADINSQLKFAISAIIIATPIFYTISHLINKGLQKGELKKDSGIRRWLTYVILLVSSLIVLGVFISIINIFLSGELTGRFILKALTIFLISATVFAFYFYDIKRENTDQTDKIVKIFFGVSLTLVLAAFIASWFFIESPKTARERRLDQAVISNIYNIESLVNAYYDHYEKLPDTINDLKNDSSTYLDPSILIDPDTKAAIVYEKASDQNYKLCATFRLNSFTDGSGPERVSYPGNNDKNHQAGYQCLNGNLYSIVKQPLAI